LPRLGVMIGPTSQKTDQLLVAIWSRITFAEQAISGDLLAFLILSPADFHGS